MEENNKDLLISLLSSFTSEEEKLFVQNFHLYLSYGDDENKFVIDLDNVWSYMGFSKKCHAKTCLEKNFLINKHYICSVDQTHIKHGGNNKEIIKMNIDTFKEMCMIANTDKGKSTRRYYLKMENIFHKHLKLQNEKIIEELKFQNEKIIEKLKLENEEIIEYNKAIERHNNLKTFYTDKPCVYILKIDHENNIIKIGETDNVHTRLIDLVSQFKEGYLVEVFTCMQPHKFEQYIINRPDVVRNRIVGTELFKLDEDITIKYFVKIIKKNIKLFNNVENIELEKIKLEQMYLETIKSETDPIIRQTILERLINTTSNLTANIENFDEEDNCADYDSDIASNRKVYKYIPEDLVNPIATYPSLKSAARSCKEVTIHDYHIRAAAKNNTIFKNHRWYYIDDDKEFSVPPTEEEKKAEKKRKGSVAQLDSSGKNIINVFPSQIEASKTLKILNCSITTAITLQRQYKGYMWNMYESLSDEVKATFDGELPEKIRTGSSNKGVEKIDITTNNVIETYACIQDVCNLFKTSHKTIHKLSKSGDIYKGFKWRVIL